MDFCGGFTGRGFPQKQDETWSGVRGAAKCISTRNELYPCIGKPPSQSIHRLRTPAGPGFNTWLQIMVVLRLKQKTPPTSWLPARWRLVFIKMFAPPILKPLKMLPSH
jgi:hypothetical protein